MATEPHTPHDFSIQFGSEELAVAETSALVDGMVPWGARVTVAQEQGGPIVACVERRL